MKKGIACGVLLVLMVCSCTVFAQEMETMTAPVPPVIEPHVLPAPPVLTEYLWDLTHGVHDYYIPLPTSRYSKLLKTLYNSDFAYRSCAYLLSVAEVLSRYKILVICIGTAWCSPYLEEEIVLIKEYVQNGGGLLILADSLNAPNENIAGLAQEFGINIAVSGIPQASISTFPENNELFSGLESINLFGIGELTVGTGATIVARDIANRGCVATAEYGAGRVVVIGDMNLFENIHLNIFGNQHFLVNVFEWLSKTKGKRFIKNFNDFPSFPYNSAQYRNNGAFVGCGPTTGAMIFAYFDHSFGSRLLTNPGTEIDEGLKTAWALHGIRYMNTQNDGFNTAFNIKPGLGNYARIHGYKLKTTIHVSPTFSPTDTTHDWNDYGPYGNAWTNDALFWEKLETDKWRINIDEFCDFLAPCFSRGIPIFLAIDTNADGKGNHWVPLVGYNRSTGQYAYYNTWDTELRWAAIYSCSDPEGHKQNSITAVRTVKYEGALINYKFISIIGAMTLGVAGYFLLR
ncbi:MAG TPA: hypothetical protein PLP19_20565 [bacterium]|nr:hypothetical protein [bacterium]HPN45889.1 hypothetical protein [bacterium]